MVLAQWVLGGVALLGALMLVPLGLRLWRRVNSFKVMIAEGSTGFADAVSRLEAARAARTTGTEG